MDEFKGGGTSAVGAKAAELVDHAAGHVLGDPDVAVYGPDDVALGLSVRSAKVSDLRVRADVVVGCIITIQVRIFGLYVDLGVEIGEVGDELA